MDVVFRRGDLLGRPAGALVVGVLQRERRLAGVAAAVDRASRGAISALLRRRDFTGASAELAVLYPSGLRAERLVVVGLGPRAELTAHRVRLAAAAGVRRARDLRAGIVVTGGLGAGGLDPAAAAQATAEGAVLGPWRFAAYRTRPGAPALRRVEVVEATDAKSAKALAAAVGRGARWAEAVVLARDLTCTPADDLTPVRLAARAREVARAAGAKVRVLDVPALERMGMNGILGVGRGSAHPPRFVVLERGPAGGLAPGRRTPTVVVIGKGVTFDTGGISLKPRDGLHELKDDMAGAAVVLGLFAGLPRGRPTLRTHASRGRPGTPPVRVVGLIPAAENMPGGRALKPGDVLRLMNGTTVEVTNTDAEGRLLLADALVYARRYPGATVVDVATLTGAIGIALGHFGAGLFTTDDRLAAELLAAGEAAGERLWRMPLSDDYDRDLESDTADLVNAHATREGDACVAARFLQRFAGEQRWAHLDIAGVARAPADRPHERRGPTGYGVRLLLEWLARNAGVA
jgi:leucyl aminopeptidase